MLQYISEICTDVRHISGPTNVVADALSRNPVNETTSVTDLTTRIARAQRDAGMIRDPLDTTWPDHWKTCRIDQQEVVVDTRASLPRPVVPPEMTQTVFASLHNMSHPGIKATRKLISGLYVWPTMSRDITEWVRTCAQCQAAKVTTHTKTAFRHFDRPPSSKFADLHVDLVGPLPPSQGYRYLLTVVDRFSRWAEAFPITNIEAATCAETLVHGWVQRYGVPVSIVTDRGRQFTSSLWDELMELLGIAHMNTTAYHPQANGMVERFHRHLKASLKARSVTSRWSQELPLIMLGIRACVKEDHGCSSFDMVFGEAPRLPAGFFVAPEPQSHHDYLVSLRAFMRNQRFVEPTWHRRDSPRELHGALSSCTHVYERIDAVKSPLQQPYAGPFLVLERHDKYFLIDRRGKPDTVSLDRLKPAFMVDSVLSGEQPSRFSSRGRLLRKPGRFHDDSSI